MVVGFMLMAGLPVLPALNAQMQENRIQAEDGEMIQKEKKADQKKLQHEEQLKQAERLKEEQMRRQEALSAVKELTIRNSGFRSRSTVVIRYRDADKAIVEVIENGKSLPESEFPRYQAIMQKVLELPEIDRLIPEIERAHRLAESPEVSEERVYREMMALRSRLSGLDSELAHRYRETAELRAMTSLSRRANEISESQELSNEEKIRRLKELLEEAAAMEMWEERSRQKMFSRFAANEAARKLIKEIELSQQLSREEKLNEIREILQRTRELEQIGEDERMGRMVEFRASETLARMLREVAENKTLSEMVKEKEMQALIEESKKMDLERNLMVRVEKFKFDLSRLLEAEGLMPKAEADFVLRKNSSSIDGKKLPQAVHEKIMRMCEETIGKKFDSDTKIVLQLNSKR
jgi:hypothetical protein